MTDMKQRVTPGPEWIKSSLSFANGNCVEVQFRLDGGADVRNSRDPDGPVLHFTAAEWDSFIDGVRKGEFDRFGELGKLTWSRG
jgi:hypothetical protein